RRSAGPRAFLPFSLPTRRSPDALTRRTISRLAAIATGLEDVLSSPDRGDGRQSFGRRASSFIFRSRLTEARRGSAMGGRLLIVACLILRRASDVPAQR